MPTIKIGDKLCEYEGDKTILQVALENNIEIPHYCYHPGLTVVASCRICLSEVAQPNPKTGELQKIPKLVPTCQHKAVDGAEVYIDSEKTKANQKAVMEYLLISHPLDCPVCDQAGECYLQDYSYEYGRAESRFEETKTKNPKKDIGDNVLLYADRCIFCSRCVRFTREVSGTGELGFMGRGHTEEIDIFPGRPLNNELSGNVVDICPVGALLDKDFLFDQRVWYLKRAPSIDPITASGDNIWIDHNEGRVWRVKPRDNAEINKWWISDEIRYGWKFVHADERLRKPTRKVARKQEETTWAEALEAAAAAMRGKNVALLASPMISVEDAFMLGQTARTFDEQATLGVGPIPVMGEDKTFPGGYTICAEKAPNARGVRRALEQIAGKRVVKYETMLEKLAEEDIDVVLAVGGYPSEWATDDFVDALKGKTVIAVDTLPNKLTEKANIVLPAATWAEKSGTFENHNGVLQAFEQAITPLEFVRPEGQIALDLLAAAGEIDSTLFDAAKVRQVMGGEMVEDVKIPVSSDAREPSMEYVEL